MKSPIKESGLAPRKVPFAEPLWIVFDPSWTRDEVLDEDGVPVRAKALVPEALENSPPPMFKFPSESKSAKLFVLVPAL